MSNRFVRLVVCIYFVAPGAAIAIDEPSPAPAALPVPHFQVAKKRVLLIPSAHFPTDARVGRGFSLPYGPAEESNLFIEYIPTGTEDFDHPFGKQRYTVVATDAQLLKMKLARSFDRLVRRSGANSAPMDELSKIHPYFLLAAIESNCGQQLQVQESSLDQKLLAAAKDAGWKSSGIETITESFISVLKIPFATWIDILQNAATKVLEENCSVIGKRYVHELSVALLTGDIEYALRATRDYHLSLYGTSELLAAYVSRERNDILADKIEAITQRSAGGGVVLIAIGAAHFAGVDGLLRILCARGVAVSAKAGAAPAYDCN